MSAIRMTCPDCVAVFFAGMVGNWPWPKHVCLTDEEFAAALSSGDATRRPIGDGE